jgi:hypothetical protein
MGHACVAACRAGADLGFALTSGHAPARSWRAGACTDVGIAGTCGPARTRATRVCPTPVGACAGLGWHARARFRTAAGTCSPGRAVVGSASAGCTSASATCSGHSRGRRALVGGPRGSGFTFVGSTCRRAADAAPDGAFLESAGAGMERPAATRCRSRCAIVDGLGRAPSRLGGAAADRCAILECARTGRLGRSA